MIGLKKSLAEQRSPLLETPFLMSSKGSLNILELNGIQDFKAIMHVHLTSKGIKSESFIELYMLPQCPLI